MYIGILEISWYSEIIFFFFDFVHFIIPQINGKDILMLSVSGRPSTQNFLTCFFFFFFLLLLLANGNITFSTELPGIWWARWRLNEVKVSLVQGWFKASCAAAAEYRGMSQRQGHTHIKKKGSKSASGKKKERGNVW